MKNTNVKQFADTDLDLQPTALSAKQAKKRNIELTRATNAFNEAVTTDALSARSNLVAKIFERLQHETDLNWHDHAELCIGLSDIRTRDGLLRMLHDSPELRGRFERHLIREVTRSQQEFIAPLATVYAGIAWLEGQTNFTRIAVDQALEVDSSYSLAQLLDIALRHNVPPTVWASSLAAVSFEACLKGAA